MNSLFGIPMDTILRVMLVAFAIVTLAVAVLALRNRLLFKLGLRNIPRRRAQTILIIVGLMLSTVIITSAFGTGDTVSYSIRSVSVNNLGPVDETVTTNAQASNSQFSGSAGAGASDYIAARAADRVTVNLARDKDVDGATGAVVQSVPIRDLTSRQTKANTQLLAVPASYPPAFGSLTTTGGAVAHLDALGAGEVYLNDRAAHALDAHAGDKLTVYIANKPVSLIVKDVVRDENLAAGGLLSGGQNSDPALILPLDRLQSLTGRRDQVTAVLVSNRGDATAGAALTASVTDRLRALLANPTQVAAAKNTLAGPTGQAALVALQKAPSIKGNAATLQKIKDLRAEARRPGASDKLKGLLGDGAVLAALHGIKDRAVTGPLDTALSAISDYSVATPKKDGLDSADQAGSVFSTIFVVFGLFSIAAGIMLIFLIFVMLAAERRAEMGMARAIGTKRRHLIEQFLFEGYAYDLGAALVGVLLGIGVGLGMVKIMASIFGVAGFDLRSHIEPRSVVIAFCLGALITFLTVSFSSWRVSRLNVVAAIRDLPDDLHVDGGIGAAFQRPLTDLQNAGRRLRRGRPFGALGALLAAPWHLVTAFRVFISRGPLLLLAGFLLLQLGISSKQSFPFSLGASLLLVGAAMLLRWIMVPLRVPDRLRNRIGYSLAGLSLVVYWLLPFDAIRKDLNGGIEMFFLSGMMLVLGGVWTIMYNSDLLLGGLLLVFGRVGGLAPALKMAVTYPLQNRFRTGLTISMFGLVIFTLMIMAVLTNTFGTRTLDLNRDRGGYDLYGATGAANPVRDVAARVQTDPSLRGKVTAAGGIGQLGALVRQPGQRDGNWQPYRVNVADDGYLSSTRFPLHLRATGYSSDAAVWQALRTRPGYAVVDADIVKSANGGSDRTGLQLAGFTYDDKSFKPARIEVRDPRGGTIVPLTVIGVLDQGATYGSDVGFGVYTGQKTLAAARVAPAVPNELFFRVAPGQDVHQAALKVGSAFLSNGLDVVETRARYDQNQALGTGLYALLQGFMGLGLIVGIAALGVIATRSVVERRQQIGMMRAIGFKRRMVRNTFLLESSVISLVGTALGVVLGLLLARNLVASFAKNNPAIHTVIPWGEIGLIVVLAYAASLLTTYLPSWQAARIYPAEALRYE